MGSDGRGNIRFVENSIAEMKGEKDFYERIEHFLLSSSELVAPGAGHALEEYERDSVQTTLGTAAGSTIAAASGTGVLVYSDDLVLRLAAQNEHKIRSFWSQTLLRDLRDKGLMSMDEYHKAVVWLIESGYNFVSVDQADLVWVIRDSEWAPTPRVAKVLATLAGPDCAMIDAVNVALNVLHEIWALLIPHSAKSVLLDLMIQVLISGRNGAAVLDALSKRNATRSIIWTSATSEIQQSIRLWADARRRGLLSTRDHT